MVRPIVDFNRCAGKQDGVVVCACHVVEIGRIDSNDHQSLSLIGKIKHFIHGGMVAYTPQADQCRTCGLCVKACPEDAIRLGRTAPSQTPSKPALDR